MDTKWIIGGGVLLGAILLLGRGRAAAPATDINSLAISAQQDTTLGLKSLDTQVSREQIQADLTSKIGEMRTTLALANIQRDNSFRGMSLSAAGAVLDYTNQRAAEAGGIAQQVLQQSAIQNLAFQEGNKEIQLTGLTTRATTKQTGLVTAANTKINQLWAEAQVQTSKIQADAAKKIAETAADASIFGNLISTSGQVAIQGMKTYGDMYSV